MMKVAVLTPNVSVLAQPTTDEVVELARRGYRSLVSNRPDGESPDQPAWADLAATAADSGMEATAFPIVIGQISDAQVAEFRTLLEALPRPIAMYCRSGTRAAFMWALANQANLTADERIEIAAREGFDLEPFRERLGRDPIATA